MSRLAKKPIKVPEGVTIEPRDSSLIVKGPAGERHLQILADARVEIHSNLVTVKNHDTRRQNPINTGTMWSLIRNAIQGVTRGFSKTLEIEGIGYRAVREGQELMLFLGYAEPIRFPIPHGISVQVEKNTLTISGVDKELVGRVAAQIRALKKPEPYKGKGIRYRGEEVKRKVGKKAGVIAETAT